MAGWLRRAWAEIDLDAVEGNYRTVASRLSPGCRGMAVVKADAYGHGAVPVARALVRAGADWFGVSNLDEAVQLREAGIDAPILILSYTPPEEAPRLARYDITQAVVGASFADHLEQAAAAAGVTVRVHIKLDTGMSRVGFPCRGGEREIDAVAASCRLPHLQPEGIFTHFASADEQDDGGFTQLQYSRFMEAVGRLERQGIRFTLRHCCNSAAAMRFPEMHMDMVRPGIILYGVAPAPWMEGMLPLQPAMQMKSVLSLVKALPGGIPVSYGRTFATPGDRMVATVPVGYADGYPRCLSNRADMLVAGRRARVIGRVCMDQCMLDVTGAAGLREGMEVTVFGRDGGVWLPVEEFSRLAGTIPYETVCLIGKRVPRVYFSGGREVGRLNYLLQEGCSKG